MNIVAAAHYLKAGYRIRRACWEPEEYLYEIGDMLEKREIHESTVFKDGKIERLRYLGHNHIASIGLGELLADDWEVITEGIRKHYNKNASIEYNDEPDWDNYVCKGWDEEE